MRNSKVKCGERLLDSWFVELCEDSGEWAVSHYIGGEDYMLFDDFFPTEEEAKTRARALSLELGVHEYYRDWEGDD